MRIKETLLNIPSVAATISWYKRLTNREKYIVLGAIIVVAIFSINELSIKPIKSAFTSQTAQLATLEQDYKTVPFIIDRYRKFNKKKQEIEQEFQLVEIKEGEQSLLENILTGKVDSGFDINPGVVRAFGGSYEQASFSVRFTINSLSALVDLLTEISTGSKRMLLTALSISKEPSGERLRVEISVSSIRRIK